MGAPFEGTLLGLCDNTLKALQPIVFLTGLLWLLLVDVAAAYSPWLSIGSDKQGVGRQGEPLSRLFLAT